MVRAIDRIVMGRPVGNAPGAQMHDSRPEDFAHAPTRVTEKVQKMSAFDEQGALRFTSRLQAARQSGNQFESEGSNG